MSINPKNPWAVIIVCGLMLASTISVFPAIGGSDGSRSFGFVQNIDTGENFTTIQAAIDDTDTLDGHTIEVSNGTYYEHLVVNKSLSLIGEDKNTTIIDGNGTGDVVHIVAPSVNISGFTIREGGDFIGALDKDAGIDIDNADLCCICDNYIIDNELLGIRLYQSWGNTIENNNCSNNQYGIYTESSSSFNTVTDNMLFNNSRGIYMTGGSDNELRGNTCYWNSYGILFSAASGHNITENTLDENFYGFYIQSGDNNDIYHNNFINNDISAHDEGSNNWDDGYPSGGNYWSDYTGVDFNSTPAQNVPPPDGIGDTPYFFDFEQDDYPLMEPCIFVLQPSINVSKTVDQTVAQPEDILTYTIFFNNTGTGNATDVWINDTLPANVTYIADTAGLVTGATFVGVNLIGQDIYYEFADVMVGVHSFTIMAMVDAGVPDGTWLTNNVTCEYAPSGIFTLDWADTFIQYITAPDIWIDPTSFDFVLEVNQTDSDILTVGNDGPEVLNYNITIDGQSSFIFSDNFDTEVEGTSPPINWVPDTQVNYIPQACEVDNQHSKSGPHSMYLESPSVWFGCCHHNIPEGFSDEPYYYSVYPASTSIVGYLFTQNSVGNFDLGDTAAALCFRNDGYIKYYTGGGWINTGVSYVANSWNDMVVVHDVNNNTFDCWHNGAQIINDGAFNAPSSSIKSLQFGLSSVGSPDYMWIDDIQIGNSSGGADWLTTSPLSGSLPQFWTENHTVTVNSTGLAPGFYQTNITIESNDPDENPLIIPVNLTVIDSTGPDIWIDPTSFDFVLEVDQTDSDILTVGNSGLLDLSYNITYSGSDESYALYFDGINDYVDCGNDPSLNGFNDFTLEAWVNASDSGIDRQDIFSKYTATDNYRLTIGGGGKVHFIVRSGSGTSSEVVSNYSIFDGKWNHVVGVRSSGTLYIYIDGILDNLAPDNEVGQISPSSNLLLGRRSDLDCELWGKLDEARIVNRALNSTEVLEDFLANGYYPSRSGTVGWWHFDENNGTIAYDSSGFGNDGFIYGASWTQGYPPGNFLFFDNFDSEIEGTSPPINWVPDTQVNYIPQACEVDNQHSKSGPHSLYLESPSVWFGYCHHDIPESFSDEPYYYSVYPTSTSIVGYLYTQNSVGNFDLGDAAAALCFRNDGYIKYYTGGGWINTGVSYIANSWNDMVVVHDVNNNTFDCWHNGAQIINDGAFNAPSSSIKSLQFGLSSVGNPDYMWIDDVQIGEGPGGTESFIDDFDSEAEGTGPPANWVEDTQANYNPTFCEVDDTHYYSAPNSMWIARTAPWFGWVHHDYPSGATSEPWYFKMYALSTTQYLHAHTQGTTGNFDLNEIAVYLSLYNNGNIQYYDGVSWVDTGYDYAVGWNSFKIIHDVDNDTFDCWYEGTEIVDDGDFWNSVTSIKSFHFGVNTVGSPDQFWVDDVQIGDEPGPGADWLTVSPLSGSLPQFWTENHTVTVNSTGLAPGFYQANITIESNDPDENPIIVPVNLTVVDNLTGPVHNINTDEYFDEIQAAIDDPDTLDGHTIEVAAGIYYEHLLITKSLTLIGESRYNTVVDGSSTGVVMHVYADGVNISEFTIQRGDTGVRMAMGSESNDITNTIVHHMSLYGIQVGDNFGASRYNLVHNNSVNDTGFFGIFVLKSSDNEIFGNTAYDNGEFGIYVKLSHHIDVYDNLVYGNIYGICLRYFSYNNTVFDNDALSNNYMAGTYATAGIAVQYNCYENMIYDNYIWNQSSENGTGIMLEEANNNTFSNNEITGNWYGIYQNNTNGNIMNGNQISYSEVGIYLNSTCTNNLIYNNSFTNNSQHAVDYNPEQNFWNATYPIGGNYWDDYNGTDIFSGPLQDQPGPDGFGDTAYSIPDSKAPPTSLDYYPLMGAGIPDLQPPEHFNHYPAIDGFTCDPTPVIFLHVADQSGVNISSIRLWVNGFMVFYDTNPITNGYNVSYWHEGGFFDGQIVICRIVADDMWGNTLDFTWNFTVDLTAPWILWTDPFDGEIDVLLDHNITVCFSEPMNTYTAELAFEISPWVDGAFNWINSTTMIFDPFDHLQWNTTYLVTMSDYARDLAGNRLGNYSWNFTTEDTDLYPPEHSNESPPINGFTKVLDTTISVHVTDVSGVNTSTIKFYINGYRVFHTLTPIADGYNVSYWHEMGFSPGETVMCRIVAQDMFGNELDFTWFFTVFQSFSIDLMEGWNFISYPLSVWPSETAVERLFSSIDGCWDMVQHYNASDINDPWKTYATFKPAHLNDLQYLYNHHGFWLHATNATTLVIYGFEDNYTQIYLKTGWNMVGYPTLTSKPISEALNGTGYTAVEGFDPNSPYNTIPLNDTYMMKPGEGYWVEVAADTFWTIDW